MPVQDIVIIYFIEETTKDNHAVSIDGEGTLDMFNSCHSEHGDVQLPQREE